MFLTEILECEIINDEILLGINEVQDILSRVEEFDSSQVVNTRKELEIVRKDYLSLREKIKAVLNCHEKLNWRAEPYEYENWLHSAKDVKLLANAILKQLIPVLEVGRDIKTRLSCSNIKKDNNGVKS